MNAPPTYNIRIDNSVELDDSRFVKILWRVIVLFIVMGLVIPFLPVFEVDREQRERIPPRIAKVLLEKKLKKIPPVVPKKSKTKKTPEVEEPKKKAQDKKPKKAKKTKTQKVKVKDKKAIQKKMAKVGLLALRDELTALRNDPILNRITQSNQKLSSNARTASKTRRAPIVKNVSKGSGGIDTSKLSKATTQTVLATRSLTQVSTHIKNTGDDNREGEELVNGRSLENIRLVIERYKGSLQTLYMRQLRKTPGIQGTVLFDFTIAPSGKVIACKVVQSELNSPRLERKFRIKFKSIDFGAEDVETTNYRYPLVFLPSRS